MIYPFDLSVEEIERTLQADAPLLPELMQAQASCDGLRALPQAQRALAETASCMTGLTPIPPLSYSLYRAFQTTGHREPFETPYWLRRQRVTALALRMILGGDAGLHEPLQDYLWAICEETTWTEPWHEGRTLCLSSASTAVTLAETLALLGTALTAEVRNRVRQELDRRVFTPYLERTYDLDRSWGVMNWNSVCNSGIGMAFLAAEPDQGRVALAVHQAIRGLRRYLEEGFAADGSTSEGVGYWHYGMSWLTLFAETLRARTSGAIDLLSTQRIRQIAAYPAKMRLTGRQFATFSDSPVSPTFQSGIVARLAERSGEHSLYGLIDPDAPLNGYDVPGLLRDMLWRQDAQPPSPVEDALLPDGGVIRLVSPDAHGNLLVLMAKAGHNDEHHNHNDVGSFILHCDGEDLLVDPGAGVYNGDYFNERRYENPFANSYGHSVPRIGGSGQGVGAQFRGEIIAADLTSTPKRVQIALHSAYSEACGLSASTRELTLHGGTTLVLHDRFVFTKQAVEVEEALVTWGDVEIDGATARIRGERHDLNLSIKEPMDVCFEVETLTEASLTNERNVLLKRLTATAPGAMHITFLIRMEIIPVMK